MATAQPELCVVCQLRPPTPGLSLVPLTNICSVCHAALQTWDRKSFFIPPGTTEPVPELGKLGPMLGDGVTIVNDYISRLEAKKQDVLRRTKDLGRVLRTNIRPTVNSDHTVIIENNRYFEIHKGLLLLYREITTLLAILDGIKRMNNSNWCQYVGTIVENVALPIHKSRKDAYIHLENHVFELDTSGGQGIQGTASSQPYLDKLNNVLSHSINSSTTSNRPVTTSLVSKEEFEKCKKEHEECIKQVDDLKFQIKQRDEEIVRLRESLRESALSQMSKRNEYSTERNTLRQQRNELQGRINTATDSFQRLEANRAARNRTRAVPTNNDPRAPNARKRRNTRRRKD